MRRLYGLACVRKIYRVACMRKIVRRSLYEEDDIGRW